MINGRELCLIYIGPRKAASTECLDIPSGAAMRNQFFRINQYRKDYRSLLINGLLRGMFVDGSALK